MQDAVQLKQSTSDTCGQVIDVISPVPYKCFKSKNYIMDICGETVSTMRMAPSLFARNIIDTLRHGQKLSQDEIRASLVKTAEIFAKDELCGLSPEQYIHLTMQVTGLPEITVVNALEYISFAVKTATQVQTLGQIQGSSWQPGYEQAMNGCAQWIRKGDILAVIAPGNSPGVHSIWPQAVALGYRVILRPSEREPFTAQRLLAAMIKAGLREYVALMPTDYNGVDALIEEADLSLVYGGNDTVKRYTGMLNVLLQGPGRSKIIIGKDYPRDLALSLVFESVTGLGGVACVCTSSVLVEGNAKAFAQDFHDFAREKFSDGQQWAIQFSKIRFAWLKQLIEQSRNTLLQDPISIINPNGTHSVMPLIHVVQNIQDPLVQLEFPVASVTFTEFNRTTDLPFLGVTLAMTVASEDEELIADINERSEIRNLYIGQVPTIWMQPTVPHDGFLSEFLMTTRGYRICRPSYKE